MTIIQLSYMITIAETGSLNKAAEQLYVSQPSLSNAIKELEKELGVTLLNRSGRGVTLTADGAEFLYHAKEIYNQYENLMQKYGKSGSHKKKFAVSTQHYSFAVKAFVDMAQLYDMTQYEFAIKETKTKDVIEDVSSLRSEIGVLYLCDFNRKAMTKILDSNNLEFHHLVDCQAYVYMWKGHPLAQEKEICLEQLAPYPCLSFDQGDNTSFYYAEEIFTTKNYPKIIKINDRATVLNLMVGLNGYTLCSGIICEELNGSDYVAVPFLDDDAEEQTGKTGGIMEIGYITKKGMTMSKLGEEYIAAMKQYLDGRE